MEDYAAGKMIIYHGKDNDHYRKSQTLYVCLSVCLSPAVSVCLLLFLSLVCVCLAVSQV